MFREWLHTTLTRMHPGHLFDVLVPPDASMGDFSVNLAFVLAKSEKKNPREVAQALCDALVAEGGAMIERCEVAGPGFVNVFLKDAYLQERLAKSEIPSVGGGKKVIVEYSSPNIAKPMHIGHLRSTIIGDALANIYEALGYEVIRWNFIGDWGTQFGKLIAYYKKLYPTGDISVISDSTKVLSIYVAANQEIDEDLGRKEFSKLEEGDTENTELWKLFRKQSLTDFEKMYQRIGVSADVVVKGESDYEPRLKPLIAELENKGIAQESEGALIVDLSDQNLSPALLRKSDGATLYLTRDLASLEDRIATYHPSKILYVVANQQALHFEQLFAVKDKLNLGPTETVHVKFGMVLGEDGKKLATREGKVIPLQEVIDKITALAAEKNPQTAREIGLGALKYNDLRQHPYSDIVFDWDAMLDLGGNSGPYLQYTYARLMGITRNVHQTAEPDIATLVHPVERMIMRHVLDFGYAVSQCAQLYTLNGLALYLYELATLANRYYEEVRLSEDTEVSRQAARLELVTVVAATLKKGLALLGIEALERI